MIGQEATWRVMSRHAGEMEVEVEVEVAGTMMNSTATKGQQREAKMKMNTWHTRVNK